MHTDIQFIQSDVCYITIMQHTYFGQHAYVSWGGSDLWSICHCFGSKLVHIDISLEVFFVGTCDIVKRLLLCHRHTSSHFIYKYMFVMCGLCILKSNVYFRPMLCGYFSVRSRRSEIKRGPFVLSRI